MGGAFRLTDVWDKRNGEWHMASLHSSKIRKWKGKKLASKHWVSGLFRLFIDTPDNSRSARASGGGRFTACA